MAKKLEIEILSNGQMKAEIKGFKGKGCVKYIEILEELLDAEVVDSDYTDEYYETEYEGICEPVKEVEKNE
jgi:hypothetical protein